MLSGSAVEHLFLAQGMIMGSWDRVLHQATCVEPASASPYVSASLSVSLMKKKKKELYALPIDPARYHKNHTVLYCLMSNVLKLFSHIFCLPYNCFGKKGVCGPSLHLGPK